MHKYKFTFDYSGEHLKIRHEESPRFIVTLKDDANHLLEQDIIISSTWFEWIDAAPESQTELAKLITQTVQAFNEHEETIKRDILNSKKGLQNLDS